ncbi:hypothetical protein KI387_002985, partial [Taxus chinensis]
GFLTIELGADVLDVGSNSGCLAIELGGDVLDEFGGDNLDAGSNSGCLTIELGGGVLDVGSNPGCLAIELGGDVLDVGSDSCNTEDIFLYVDLPLDPSQDIGHLVENPKAVTTGRMEGGVHSPCVVSPRGNFGVNPFDMPLDHMSAKGHISSSTRGPMHYVSGHDVLDPFLNLSSYTDSFESRQKRPQSGMTHSSDSIENAVQQGEFFVSDTWIPGKSCSESAILDKRSRELFLQQNNFVYKRKKVRHSVTLLSGYAHTEFSKESVQSDPSKSNRLVQGDIENFLETEVNPKRHCKNPTTVPEDLHPDKNKAVLETDANDKVDDKNLISDYQISNLEKAGNVLENGVICNWYDKSDISATQTSDFLLQSGKTTKNSGSNQMLNGNCFENPSRYSLLCGDSFSMSQSESSSFPYNFDGKVKRHESYVEVTCKSMSDSGSFSNISTQGGLSRGERNYKLRKIMDNNQDELSEADAFGSCIPDVTRVAEEKELEREWCISILKESKLLTFLPGKSAVTEHPGVVGDGRWDKRCKVCDTFENSTSTLICDMCEESFHMACCNPKVVSIPVKDNWYCTTCRRKRKRSVIRSCIENRKRNRHGLKFQSRVPDKNGNENFIKEKAGLFLRMLQDTEAYTTQVRIGKDYQADVPSWTGEVICSAESPFMGELLSSAETPFEPEVAANNLKNDIQPKDWEPVEFLPRLSKQNWLQCQNVLYSEGEICPDGRKARKDIICGKWR